MTGVRERFAKTTDLRSGPRPPRKRRLAGVLLCVIGLGGIGFKWNELDDGFGLDKVWVGLR